MSGSGRAGTETGVRAGGDAHGYCVRWRRVWGLLRLEGW